jgi:O-antigen/teichoic acid export membrane protein
VLYEVLYFSICTIVFACAMILIVPFVMVYTKDITDVNYSRPIFAILLVLSEMFCMVRLPYISITYAAGHFKQTQIGAWVEAIINIVLSVILVVKYGIIGVAIGTLVAMIIRTMEFVNYSSKNILKRKVSQAYKKITILLIEIILTIPLWIYVNKFVVINNYIEWITNAFFVFIIVTFEVGIINFICYKKELGNILDIIKIKIKVKK